MEGGLADYGFMSPELGGYWECAAENGELRWHPWGTNNSIAGNPAETKPAQVAVLKCGEAMEAVTLGGEGPKLVSFGGVGAASAFDSAKQAWTPLPAERLGANEAYSKGLAVWEQSRARQLNPSLGKDGAKALIAKSRSANVMVPESSFIVVESAAQWKMLSEKEKQKLSANQALEMEAVPEPTTAVLLGLGAAWGLGRRWRRAPGTGCLP
jgi:hypothetical protein